MTNGGMDLDAFLMIGQSNMSGRGDMAELPELVCQHVWALRGEKWEIAREPVVRDRPFSAAGMGIAFGGAVYAFTGRDVGLLPCSLGGSPLASWQSGQENFERAVSAAKTSLRLGARLSGILWHQGETDSKDCALSMTYLKNFAPMIRSLVARIRAEADALGCPERALRPLPVLVGELGDYLDDNRDSKYHRIVNEQLHLFAALAPHYACVTAHDLPDKGDTLHFSALSQRRLGVRYASAWADIAFRRNEDAAARDMQKTEYV